MDSESIYSLFATDKNQEVHGKWVSVGRSQFLLARAGGSNTRFANAYTQAMKPYQRQQQLGKLSEEEMRTVLVDPVVQHVVLDWRWKNTDEELAADPSLAEFREHQIKDKAGVFLTYSKGAAKALLLEIPDLLSLLFETAGNISTFSPDDIEAALGN